MKNSFFLLVLLLITSTAIGQTPDSLISGYLDYERPRDYTIADVTITGVKFLQTNYLVNISGLAVGQEITIPGDKITQAIDNFWLLGLFSDVKIIATKVEGKSIYLEIRLKEQPRLTKITLHGLKKSETKDVEEKINLKPGNQVTENVLNNTITIIKKHYVDKGFFKCKVDIVQKADTTVGNRVFLDINIDKGKRVKISDIEFLGNNTFTDERLRRTMKKTKQTSLNFFKPSKYVDAQYKEDKKSLIDFYNKNGYRDAKIVNAKLVDLNNKRIGLEVTLEEGIKYYIRDISWVGNTKHLSGALARVLGMNRGDVYDQAKINERLFSDDDAITSLYMDEGYLFLH